MNKLLIILALCSSFLHAQLVTSFVSNPLDVVENTIAGHGIQVLSVNTIGSSDAIGCFSGINSNIGFDFGAILTTGVISGHDGPVGPNDVGNAGFDNGTSGFPEFAPICSWCSAFNATVIQISFIPNGDSIFLKYVFGSEEYLEYVGTQTADFMAIIIDGPIPGGGYYNDQNFATVPGSNLPVSINYINSSTSNQYYINNETPPGTSIQYDGFTTPLIARIAVIPDSIYTINIGVTDVGDGIYDSGIFLEAGSFSSGTYIGMEEVSKPQLKIYPNPAEEFIMIESPNNYGIDQVFLTDVQGRLIKNETCESFSVKMDLSGINPGIYFLHAEINGQWIQKKFIVR